jgi:tetratricopeptide (TPR) repeat protein
MRNHLYSLEEAEGDLLKAATYLAENIKSSDGHGEAVKEIVARLLAQKEVDNAAALADTVDDPFVRDRLLLQVADECAALDDDEYALQLVEAIEQTDFQSVARERLAMRKASIGEFEKAFELAETLAHPSDALAAIAVRQTAKGFETEAAETLAKIEYPLAKVNAYLAIAAHHEANDSREKSLAALENAFAETKDIEFTEERIRALQEIAAHYNLLAQNDKAIETLAAAQGLTETLDGVHRDAIFSSVALGFLRAGSIDLAERALDLIQDKVQIASTLAGYAVQFDEKGERDDALETLEEAYQILKSQSEREVRDSKARFDLFASIAVLFARFGKFERALEIASENRLDAARHNALAQIAAEQAAQGNDEAARQALNLIDEEAARLFALIGISDARRAAENTDEAVKYLEEAANFAAGVPQLAARSAALKQLTEKFHALNRSDAARASATENLQIIAQIRDDSAKAVSLLNLADVCKSLDFDLNETEQKILQTMLRKAEW